MSTSNNKKVGICQIYRRTKQASRLELDLILQNEANLEELPSPIREEHVAPNNLYREQTISSPCGTPTLSDLEVSPDRFSPVSHVSSSHLDTCIEMLEAERNENWSLEIFKNKLCDWALTQQITQSSVSFLLKILKTHPDFKELPSDARTLLKTPRHTEVQQICGGSYVYFGILKGIVKILENESDLSTSIELLISVDGLPIAKSSGSQLWPQLGKIKSLPNSPVFTIGMFHGYNKPTDANTYMNLAVEELSNLLENGFHFKNNLITIKHVGFVCDAPAKSFLLQIKGHTGFFSCTRCEVEGNYGHGRVYFPDTHCIKKSHEDFKNQKVEEYHTGDSILVNLRHFDVVKDVSLDYMHLVCLGVVKKLITLWMKGSLSYRLSSLSIKSITKTLLTFRKFIPSEFARHPRGLDELKRWKATEFRQFLIYTGPVALVQVTQMPKKILTNFLCLSVSMNLLLNAAKCEEFQSYVKSLLEYFVTNFGKLYGKHLISHNVHGLIHIADDVSVFGSLDNCSSFPFENYMQEIKKMLRSNNSPLQQIQRRIAEKEFMAKNIPKPNRSGMSFRSIHDGVLINGCTDPQYKICFKEGFKLSTTLKDSHCRLSDGTIIKIYNFASSSSGMVVIGQPLKRKGCLFEKPCKSSELGIFIVQKENGQLNSWKVEAITNKMIVLPFKNNCYAALPIIHTEA